MTTWTTQDTQRGRDGAWVLALVGASLLAVFAAAAWTVRPEALWVRVQRAGVHLLAFVLFFMGAAREAELPVSRALGWGFTAVVVLGLVAWAWRLRRPAGARR